MSTAESIDGLIGNTPLLKLSRFAAGRNLGATILAKLERCNVAGSAKDRISKAMLDAAADQGLIGPESTIIEPTSGNTGVSLAALGASRGLKVIIVMPETMSVERRNLIKAFGARLVLTDGTLGMKGAIAKAAEIAAETPGAFIPSQFTNPANPAIHEATTGPEIWRDTEGSVDIFVAGVGTGGTLSGAGSYLKKRNPRIRVVAVEPAGSPILSQGRAGTHKIQGIGAGFVPDTLDAAVFDEVMAISDEDAFSAGREIARREGLLVGISSGAAAAAAAQLAARPENAGKTIVAILPDTGERYLSTAMFQSE